MVSAVRTESRDAQILRLAQGAREAGMQILRDERGRYWATSISHPGTTHAVCGVACDCKAFTHRAMCSHFALLLVSLGWVGTDPTSGPTTWNVPSEPTPCRFCHGQGSTLATELFAGRRLDIRTTCWHCRGTGQLAA